MKCPKCGYLGFEAVERCRNCGYDFSLAPDDRLPDLAFRKEPVEHDSALDDLTLIDAAAPTPGRPARQFTPELNRPAAASRRAASTPEFELPLFGTDEQTPLPRPIAPRPPLAVRRATPEFPRSSGRGAPMRVPALDLELPGLSVPDPTPLPSGAAPDRSLVPEVVATAAAVRLADPIAPVERADGAAAAAVSARLAAVGLDLSVLAVVDALVIYFTLQICRLAVTDLHLLPVAPLLAFLVMQNGGYLVAFTVGGQTLGKMAAGIRVVSTKPGTPVDLLRAFVRTLVWLLLVAPAGLGFLTALSHPDRRGLHDRCAQTRVVRAGAA